MYFFEEPVLSNGDKPMLVRTQVAPQVTVLVPHLPHTLSDGQKVDAQRRLLQELIDTERLTRRTFWYYTPMSLEFSADIQADVVVYDCMDELSAFRGAPASLIAWEKKLFARADVVFTGGFSLFEAKRTLHPNVHAFPSSVDIDHFKRFNDTYGHLTGDQVLRLVSMTMREQVKIKATLARFGGEEFGIIMPDTTLEGAKLVAERVRTSVMSRELIKRSTGESLGKVTVSLGAASLRKGDTAVSLLERADQCMFIAKRNGRNRTVTDADAEYQREHGDSVSEVA